MKWNDPVRDNQLTLQEEARKRGDKARRGGPWRDSAYGGLRGRLSVRAMDIIIWSIVGVIVLAVVVGVILQ